MAVHRPSDAEGSSSYYTAVYICVSFLVVMLAGLLFYVLCSRRYRLNWYEKTQLVESSSRKDVQSSQLSIVTTSTCTTSEGGVVPLVSTPTPKTRLIRSQSSGRLESSPSSDSGQFWVPPSLQRQASVCHGDPPNDFSGDDSQPGTPNTPLGVKLFNGSQTNLDKSVLKYVQPPATVGGVIRPRVSSMYSKLDHTKINASLYQKEDSPPSTPEETTRGMVHFGVSYNPEFSLLTIHLLEIQNLAPRDFSGTADPYAKVRVLPDKAYRQSTIHRKTLNPHFDEEFVFDLPQDELAVKTIEILLFDYDQYSRHQCLGHTLLPLDGLLPLTEKVDLVKGLLQCDEATDQPNLGELMFSLGYLPSAERLTVVILKARDLKAIDDNKKTSDPFVKVALLSDGKRPKKKKKTSTQRGTLNPTFNEALTFNVGKDSLRNLALEFTVMHDNLLGQKDILGRVVLGPESKGDEAVHLIEMFASKSAVAMWHALVAAEAPTVS